MTSSSEEHESLFLPILVMALLFIVIHSLALVVSSPFEEAGMEAFENPDDPLNIVYLFAIIGVMTLIILLLAKFRKHIVKILILFAVGYTAFYVFLPLLGLVIGWWWPLFLAIALAIVLVIVLYKYPEWYIIDLSGIIIGAGAIAIFGISLGIFYILLFLIGLAIYDAISVYKTKHMIDLADTVMDLKLPVLLVVPKIWKYSLIKETKRLKEQLESDEQRDAFFMGLGDVVMPGILVIAVYQATEGCIRAAGGVMLGTLIGFAILMFFVVKGKPQAGLPLLCGGAIAGYFISSYLLFGEFIGLTLPF